MLSITFLEWELWFNRVRTETEKREAFLFDENDYQRDVNLIQTVVDQTCPNDVFKFGWNFSFEISEAHPLFWIAVYDIEILTKNFIQVFISLPKSLHIDWLVRLEIYPQIRNNVKHGDPACAELIAMRDECIGWIEHGHAARILFENI